MEQNGQQRTEHFITRKTDVTFDLKIIHFLVGLYFFRIYPVRLIYHSHSRKSDNWRSNRISYRVCYVKDNIFENSVSRARLLWAIRHVLHLCLFTLGS